MLITWAARHHLKSRTTRGSEGRKSLGLIESGAGFEKPVGHKYGLELSDDRSGYPNDQFLIWITWHKISSHNVLRAGVCDRSVNDRQFAMVPKIKAGGTAAKKLHPKGRMDFHPRAAHLWSEMPKRAFGTHGIQKHAA